MPFRVSFDRTEHLLEVVYPETPTLADVTDYVASVRAIIDGLDESWVCLVDQRDLRVMTPELMADVESLNTHALARGMMRSARLVASAVAELQAGRIARDTGVMVRSFASRTDALRWLRLGLRGR